MDVAGWRGGITDRPLPQSAQTLARPLKMSWVLNWLTLVLLGNRRRVRVC